MGQAWIGRAATHSCDINGLAAVVQMRVVLRLCIDRPICGVAWREILLANRADLCDFPRAGTECNRCTTDTSEEACYAVPVWGAEVDLGVVGLKR
jgi:hypothetical protein